MNKPSRTNPKTKANRLQAMCIGCRFNTIKNGSEFICDRPDMTPEKVTEEVINVFFGEPAICYEATPTEGTTEIA